MGLSYAPFSDPAGNIWLLQETTIRLPGTIDARTTTYEDWPVRCAVQQPLQSPDETQIGQADQELARTRTPGS